MIDIAHRLSSLYKAVAVSGITVGHSATISAIRNRDISSEDVIAFAKAAGLLAAKRTHEFIPGTAMAPVEFADIRFELGEKEIRIEAEMHTVYKSGVEMQAMLAVSVAALTLFDMIRLLDEEVSILPSQLVKVKGGVRDYLEEGYEKLRALVVVCSDTISVGKKEDKAGKAIVESLQQCGLTDIRYAIIPDEAAQIQENAKLAESEGVDLIIFTGGTGLSPRDVSPDVIAPLLDREIPGVMEAARSYGQQRTPYAMLSRGVAGMMGKSLVLTLPGSTKGAKESMDALFPALLHIFAVRIGARHDKK